MIRLTLPYPVSANRYWRPVNIGKHITIVPTTEAKAYRKEVGQLCVAAGIRAPLAGRLWVHVQLFPNRPKDWAGRVKKLGEGWDDTVQCMDLTNCEKVLLDAMNNIVFNDDKQIWRYSAERMEPLGEAMVVVRISPMVVKQPQRDLIGDVA